jgi:DNA/RNA-binding domain of Phe-tRNA-synthetase-like protein
LDIEPQLTLAFPGLQVLPLEISDLSIKERNSDLEILKKEIQNSVRKSTPSLEAVKDQPVIRAYRDFFWRVGIDPTKTRPAGEALTRRVISNRDLPTINTLVDSYNLASLETSIAIAAFDSDSVSKNLLMRISRRGEIFAGIGMKSSLALRGIEVVIEDRKSAELIAIYPYRDSEKSKVTTDTRNALLLMCGVPGVDKTNLLQASQLTENYVRRFCILKRADR